MSESKCHARSQRPRDPTGPLLDEKDGQVTPKRIIWGHSLDDFFRVAHIEGRGLTTIWSRSMQWFGENYGDERHRFGPPPRRRKPWPLLKLPKRMKVESRKYGFGVVDPGSDYDSDDYNKCHVVLIDVDSDDEGETRPLSGRDAFRKLLEKGFNKDWPPGRSEVIQKGLIEKISVEDGPKLVVFRGGINEAYFLAKLDCPLCESVGAHLCSECTVDPPPVIYVSHFHAPNPLFIKDDSTAWFADPDMPCIFSGAPMRVLITIQKQWDVIKAPSEDSSLTGALGIKILRFPGGHPTFYIIDTACKACERGNFSDCEVCGKDTTEPIFSKFGGKWGPWFAGVIGNGVGRLNDLGDLKEGSDDPKPDDALVAMSPVDSPEPPLKSPPGTVLPECTPATEENGPVRSRPSLDEEPPVDFVGDCPVPGDEKDEESDIDPATNIWNLQLSKMPPSLEENIPPEFLPDILMVEDCGNAIRYHSSHGAPISDEYSSVLDKPVKFRRVLPSPADNPKQGSPSLTQALRVAKLDLSLNYKLGRGNHSDVYLVSLRLPHPLSARTPTGEVSVACKMAHDRSYKARQLLENEAGIYASFPDAMSEGGNGYVLFTPKFKSPVPSGPVVPKFYGYYKPVYDPEYYAEEEKDLDQVLKECMKAFIEGLSPILLMEHCGSQISPWRMSNDNRNKYMSLLHRMHLADYTHKSAHVRNVVVQPGPLTLPPRSRSLKDPSFRLVDFGRTMHLSHYNKQRGAPAGRKGDYNWDCGQDDEFRELQGEVW